MDLDTDFYTIPPTKRFKGVKTAFYPSQSFPDDELNLIYPTLIDMSKNGKMKQIDETNINFIPPSLLNTNRLDIIVDNEDLGFDNYDGDEIGILFKIEGDDDEYFYLFKKLKKKIGSTVKKVTKPIKRVGGKVVDTAKNVGSKVASTAKNVGGKVAQKWKTATLSGPRAAYLALVKVNALGYASKIKRIKDGNPDQYKKIRDRWYKFGGNRTTFDNTVESGAKKRPMKIDAKKNERFDGYEEIYFMFDSDFDYHYIDPATAAAALTAAAPIIAALAGLIGQPSEMDADTQAIIDEEAENQQEQFDDQYNLEQQNVLPENQRDREFKEGFQMPLWGWIGIGVGGLSVIGLIIYLATRNK